MQPIYSFPPIATPNSRILILGSMPGILSLQRQQYYAHPRNAFWHILGELLGFDPIATYEQRVAALKEAHIALWDVLQSCHREGSLDADIDKHSIVPNDFTAFFAKHQKIRHVFFNGATAENVFRRQVLPGLHSIEKPGFTRLPSTSPAHAAMSTKEKLLAWKVIVTR